MNVDFSSKDIFVPLLEKFDESWSMAGDGSGFSFSCNDPYIRIDYILVNKGSGIQVKNSFLIYTKISDHLPVLADIEF